MAGGAGSLLSIPVRKTRLADKIFELESDQMAAQRSYIKGYLALRVHKANHIDD